MIEQRRGRLSQDFHLRSGTGAHHWFRLKARPVIGSDGEVIRIVGTLSDVTDAKTAEERLLHERFTTISPACRTGSCSTIGSRRR